MKIAKIVNNDTSNSITGFTLSIFTQGCIHECKGCFSESTWDWNGGELFKLEKLKEIILKSRHKNVSILGGDPFHPKNRVEIVSLIEWIKKETNKTVYVWTGFKKEYVDDIMDSSIIDYLIDGEFEIEKSDITLKLRGSSNQNIYKNGILVDNI